MTAQQKQHLSALTGLRFFAAMYVVLFHYTYAASFPFPDSIARVTQYGYVSVSLFFVLSGFVLAYTYLDPQNGFPINLKGFYIARFARIYPIYLLALIVSLPAFMSRAIELGMIRSVFTGAMTVSLIQAWTPWTATIWNTPLWAVSVEVFCYLLFPFLACRINQLNRRMILLLVIVLWVLAILPPLMYQFNLLNGLRFVLHAPIFHLPQFLIGVCSGIIFLKKTNLDPSNQTLGIWTLLAIVTCVLISIFRLGTDENSYVILNNGLFSPIFGLIIYALACGGGRIAEFFSITPFIILGQSSYAIYLFQNPIFSLIKLIFEKGKVLDSLDSSDLKSLLFCLSYGVVLVSFSIGVFFFIETPLKKRLKAVLTFSYPI